MYNIYAPIVPYVGMGGFTLNMSKREVEGILGYSLDAGTPIRRGTLIEYVLDDALALYFSSQDNKLKGIETRKGYKGLLMEKIGTSTNEADLFVLDPTLVYDDFDEFYESKENGYQIQTSLPDEKAEWISIFSHDLHNTSDISNL